MSSLQRVLFWACASVLLAASSCVFDALLNSCEKRCERDYSECTDRCCADGCPGPSDAAARCLEPCELARKGCRNRCSAGAEPTPAP